MARSGAVRVRARARDVGDEVEVTLRIEAR